MMLYFAQKKEYCDLFVQFLILAQGRSENTRNTHIANTGFNDIDLVLNQL